MGIVDRLAQEHHTLLVRHNHPGRYHLKLEFSAADPSGPWPELQCILEVRQQGNLLLTRTGGSSSWFTGPGLGGLTFFPYSVPEDLPARTPLEYTVRCNDTLRQLLETYGNAVLSVRKGPDL